MNWQALIEHLTLLSGSTSRKESERLMAATRNLATDLSSLLAVLQSGRKSPSSDVLRRCLSAAESYPHEALSKLIDDSALENTARLAAYKSDLNLCLLDLIGHLQDLLDQESPGPSNGDPIKASLATLEDFEKFLMEQESLGTRKQKKKKIVTYALLVLPMLGSAVGWGYLELTPVALQCISCDIVSPFHAYENSKTDRASLILSENYKDEYLRDFGKYYFGMDQKRFVEKYFIENEHTSEKKSPLKLKMLMQNGSSISPMIIKSMGIVVEYEEKRKFPWQKLDVAPKVETDLDGPYLSFLSENPAPAVDLTYRATTACGFPTVAGRIEVLKGSRRVPLTREGEDPDFERIAINGDVLTEPIYYIPEYNSLTEREPAWLDPEVEKIESVARLKEITEVCQERAMNLSYQYRSLMGEETIESATLYLPEDLAFYRNIGKLKSISTPSTEMVAPMMDHPESTVEVQSLMNHVAARMSGMQLHQLEGIDFVKIDVNMDLGGLPARDRDKFSDNIDVLLNPSGYFTVNLELANRKNGIYRVNLFVNDERAESLRLETLVPEKFRFDPKDLESLWRPYWQN